MKDVQHEIERLRRAWAATRGTGRLGRLYLAVLALLALAALANLLLGPWPLFHGLEGRVLPVLLLAVALDLLAPLLRKAGPWVARPAPRALVRRLDDSQGWGDAADTTLALDPVRPLSPVQHFLAAQTAGRFRQLEPGRLWPRPPPFLWLPRLLVLLFCLPPLP
ncbi:MAG: hypothetical protein ACC662_04880, partial [Planctomycetota bacterium]